MREGSIKILCTPLGDLLLGLARRCGGDAEGLRQAAGLVLAVQESPNGEVPAIESSSSTWLKMIRACIKREG